MDRNDEHRKKMIAPIVITVLLVIYYTVYFGFIIAAIPDKWAALLGIIPAALGAVSIYVCIQRINEIRSGEEDDLSKY
ncbi:MAG: hypothetical protein Q4B03_08795 [Lachnospiraceae bacterium]|nr:hypothetical protein [Lachnospiraceae bacterium]